MKRAPRQPGPGFTIIELLVVVAVIGVLVSLLLPAMEYARESARGVQCQSGMRQWGIAVSRYVSQRKGQLLPREDGRTSGTENGVTWTHGNSDPDAWYNALPGLIDAQNYGELFNGTTAQAETHGYENDYIWYCPSRIRHFKKVSGSGLNSFHYGMNAVLNGSSSFAGELSSANMPKKVAFDRISKPSFTIFMGEEENQPTYSPAAVDRNRHFTYARNVGKVNTVFLDGHVESNHHSVFYGNASVIGGGAANNWVWTDKSGKYIWGAFKYGKK